MIDNYFKDANTLLDKLPAEADRAWAETVIKAIRSRHESSGITRSAYFCNKSLSIIKVGSRTYSEVRGLLGERWHNRQA